MEIVTLKNVTKGSFYLTIDYIISSFLGLLFWVLAAKMVSVEDVGLAAVALASTSTLSIFIGGGGIGATASTFVSRYNAEGDYNLSRLVTRQCLQIAIIPSAIGGILLIVFSGIIAADLLKNPLLAPLIIIIALTLPFQNVMAALNGIFQGCQRMEFCAIGDLMLSTVRLLVLIPLILFSYASLGIVLSILAGYTASALVGLLVFKQKALPESQQFNALDPPKDLVTNLLKFSLPNYVSSVIGTINVSIPFFIIGFYTLTGVAYYNMAFLIVGVASNFLGLIGNALLPSISEEWTKGRRAGMVEIVNFFSRLLPLVVGPFIIAAMLYPSQILSVFDPDYSVASSAFQVLIVALIPSTISVFISPTLVGIRKPEVIMKISLLSLIVCLLLNVLLIPFMGFIGAAIARLIQTFFVLAIALTTIKVAEKIDLDLKGFLKSSACVFFSVGIGHLVLSYFKNFLAAGVVAILIYLYGATISKVITKNDIETVRNLLMGFLTRCRKMFARAYFLIFGG